MLGTIIEAVRSFNEIGLVLKPNGHSQIKLVQIPDTHVKLVQIPDTHGRKFQVFTSSLSSGEFGSKNK